MDKLRLWSAQFITPFDEALKEAFRVLLFSIPGQLIIFLESKDFLWKSLLINLLLIFLRAMDKFTYEQSKLKGYDRGEPSARGISPI